MGFSKRFSVITELIIGYMLPGRPIAMMMFKTWGYITMVQGIQFTSDFKLGHYMKISPKLMFGAQVIATIIAGTVQLGVQSWMFTNINDMCAADQRDGFIVRSFWKLNGSLSNFIYRSARQPKFSEPHQSFGELSALHANSRTDSSSSAYNVFTVEGHCSCFYP